MLFALVFGLLVEEGASRRTTPKPKHPTPPNDDPVHQHMHAHVPHKSVKFPPLRSSHFDVIAAIVEDLIDRSRVTDGSHAFLAGFVRVLFHDCVGVACDGCINVDHAPNAGLGPYITVLNKMYHDTGHKIYELMSQADFWALSALVAARRGARKGGQILSTEFRTGRLDCPTSPYTTHKHHYPDAHGDTTMTLEYWKDFFGLTYHETTALLGAHGLGKCHRDASGFEGAWTVDPDSLDNSYYKDLTNSRLGWRQQQIDMNHVQWVHGDGTSGIMLNSDMALYKAIQPKPQVSECSYVSCGPSIVASSVEAFAESNALFVTEFSSAFQKLMDHGLPHGMLSQILPTPVMQHQRTNPVPPAPMQVPIDFMQLVNGPSPFLPERAPHASTSQPLVSVLPNPQMQQQIPEIVSTVAQTSPTKPPSLAESLMSLLTPAERRLVEHEKKLAG